jgi:hypothetical protein
MRSTTLIVAAAAIGLPLIAGSVGASHYRPWGYRDGHYRHHHHYPHRIIESHHYYEPAPIIESYHYYEPYYEPYYGPGYYYDRPFVHLPLNIYLD